MTSLKERIDQLVDQHGSLRAASRNTGVDVAYLSRLLSGEKTNPSIQTLDRLGLVRVTEYKLGRSNER